MGGYDKEYFYKRYAKLLAESKAAKEKAESYRLELAKNCTHPVEFVEDYIDRYDICAICHATVDRKVAK